MMLAGRGFAKTGDSTETTHSVHGRGVAPRVWPQAGYQDAPHMVALMRDMGSTPGESLGMVAANFGLDVATAIFRQETASLGPKALLSFLADVARPMPSAAQAWLRLVLEERCLLPWAGRSMTGLWLADQGWITALPGGLTVQGALDLRGCVSLKSLPDGIQVDGALCLRGCAAMVRLPSCLKVGSWLDLRECPAWDGFIPAGVHVGSGLLTDRHPGGIRLDAWRGLAAMDFSATDLQVG